MNFRVIHDSNIPCFFQIFNYPLGRLTFIANFIPYIAGLMRQISTSLITEIYASMMKTEGFLTFLGGIEM